MGCMQGKREHEGAPGLEPALSTYPNDTLSQGGPRHQVGACWAPAERIFEWDGCQLPQIWKDMQTGPPPGRGTTCLLHHSLPKPDPTPDQREAQHPPARVHEVQEEGCSDSPASLSPGPHPLVLPVHLQLQEMILLPPALPPRTPPPLSCP